MLTPLGAVVKSIVKFALSVQRWRPAVEERNHEFTYTWLAKALRWSRPPSQTSGLRHAQGRM